MTDGNPITAAKPTLLLVEDSRLFTSVLTFRFQNELGLCVQHCGSLAAVQQALQQADTRYTLAMVDLNLPGSPRGEVLNLTLENEIPTIVFTATFSPETRAEIMQRHVVDYVMKDNDLALEKAFCAVRQAMENRRRRVLVADRSEANLAEVGQALRRMLFEVDEARSGWDAVAMLEKAAYHLVVAGEHLSDMSGAEFCRRVRKQHSNNQLGFIGLYPPEDAFNGLLFLRAGASDAVRTPIVPEEFQCRVAYHVDMLGQVQALRATAASDYLTGLYNRRYFYAEGPKLISRGLKMGRHLSIGVLDIDHFKRLNDTYGHEIGDLVLVAVANRLKNEVEGKGHLLCRLGGEEFGLLVVDLDAAEATAYFDELRRRLATVKVVADEEELSISVSIGVAEVSGFETFDNYINAADQFLYMAKHRGRNQVYSDYLMAEESARARRAAG
ncbi:diguanylate cyclase [Gellertiella hungarica]|uniref:diguanylate cyclase n=1 Tax=Gellertiella hungarica TaxID=1572859 RepID=A0A7W6J9E2_9HYPH|nr:diguanylate cyclase [Gellertiella hungarica]MBB4067182.1 diguanylate cyclase (GGDEF)-like protein [Gellertiella hungarica]